MRNGCTQHCTVQPGARLSAPGVHHVWCCNSYDAVHVRDYLLAGAAVLNAGAGEEPLRNSGAARGGQYLLLNVLIAEIYG